MLAVEANDGFRGISKAFGAMEQAAEAIPINPEKEKGHVLLSM
jgi:hypothetical protein